MRLGTAKYHGWIGNRLNVNGSFTEVRRVSGEIRMELVCNCKENQWNEANKKNVWKLVFVDH